MHNIFPSPPSVSIADRHLLNGHSGGLLWFTGLSGSGKSTLAHAVEEKLHTLCVRSYVLDGDNIRTGLNKDLGLSPEDRKENIRRIAEVAKLMVDAGLLVFAAFIAPYRQSREYVRKLMTGWPYYEEPEHPSLIIETDKLGLQQCVDNVIKFLLKQDLISTEFQPKFDTLEKIKS